MTNPLTRFHQWLRRRREPQRASIIHGWTVSLERYGVNCLVTVSAESQDEAIIKLRAAGFTIVDTEEVRQAIMLPAVHEAYLRRDVTWQEFAWKSRPYAEPTEVPLP